PAAAWGAQGDLGRDRDDKGRPSAGCAVRRGGAFAPLPRAARRFRRRARARRGGLSRAGDVSRAGVRQVRTETDRALAERGGRHRLRPFQKTSPALALSTGIRRTPGRSSDVLQVGGASERLGTQPERGGGGCTAQG